MLSMLRHAVHAAPKKADLVLHLRALCLARPPACVQGAEAGAGAGAGSSGEWSEEGAPPSAGQLEFLDRLGHSGPLPATK